MNSIIKDTNIRVNGEILDKQYIIETRDNGRKVIVRTKDFYPCLCSPKEYTELDVSTYNMLIRFKKITEGSEPDDNDDEDVPVEIYEELLKYKELENEYKKAARNDVVRIKLSDFYPDNCGDEEYCEVSRKVYEELMKNKREDHAQRVSNSRHLINCCFDESQCGEQYGIYTDSNTQGIIAALWMKDIMLPRSEELYRRSLLYYVYGLSVDEMAVIEGVTKTAINRSIRTMNKIVHSAANRMIFTIEV